MEDVDESTLTRDQRRSRRHRPVRAKTISMTRLPKSELERGRLLYPEDTSIGKPRTRAECVNGPRPCPYVSCKHHLYLDVSEMTGAIKLNFPDLEVEEMGESCALDVADRGGATLEETAQVMNITRERVRQVENTAILSMSVRELRLLAEYQDGADVSRVLVRLPILRELDEPKTVEAMDDFDDFEDDLRLADNDGVDDAAGW